jgi:hypothetical protein
MHGVRQMLYQPGVHMHAAVLLLALVMKPAVQCTLVCKLHGGSFYSAGSTCSLCGALQVLWMGGGCHAELSDSGACGLAVPAAVLLCRLASCLLFAK